MITAERHRIARELHDVIAHSLSIIVVQAGAVEGTLPPGSDQRARVAAIRQVGRSALGESRRLLTTVRAPGNSTTADDSATNTDTITDTDDNTATRDVGGAHPQPGFADIPTLVDQAAAMLLVRGTPGSSSPGLGLAAYRIVQEALTNARRHAGPRAAAAVTLDWSPTALAIEVEDCGAVERGGAGPAIPGQGLVGMRERVSMYGGTFTAGPRPDRPGWRVRAELPLVGVGV
nr:histidine kinase [Ornithinimicrobium sp. F0845]